MLENSQIRSDARNALHGAWLYPVLCTLLYFAVDALGNIPFLGEVVGILIVLPLLFGYQLTMQDVLHGDTSDSIVARPFMVFKKYGRYLGGSLLVLIFTLLWTLLFIIPGIIMSLNYAMTSYVMRDNPDLPVIDCIHLSDDMMTGHKWQLFCLYLSFIGWGILCILSLGIGFLWLTPYISVSEAKFYEEVKADYQASHADTAAAESTVAE